MKVELNVISYSKPDSKSPTLYEVLCEKQFYKDGLIWLCFQQYMTTNNLQVNRILHNVANTDYTWKALTHQGNLQELRWSDPLSQECCS